MTRFAVSQVLVLVAVLCFCNAKKDRNSPHRNKGILKSYEPGPFDLSLNSNDEKELAAGKPVMKQTMPSEDDAGGGAICVQDIAAPKEAVWNQILRMDDYMGKVSKVKECKNYQVTKHDDGTFTIKTKQVLGVMPGYSVSATVAEGLIASYCSTLFVATKATPQILTCFRSTRTTTITSTRQKRIQ